MFSQRFLYGFVIVTFVIAIVLNYSLPYASLWLLFMLPAMGIVTLFPSWKTVVIVLLFVTTMGLTMEFWLRRGYIPFEVKIRELVTFIVGFIVFINISFFRIKTAKLMKELELISLTDPLTEVYNRRYFDLYMEKSFPALKCVDTPFTVILFDIDHFKSINDTHGHHAGDLVLQKLARVIKQLIGKSDVLVRLGGEEFIVVMPKGALEQGQQLAERIRKITERINFVHEGKQMRITLSLGVAQYRGEKTVHLFIEKADQLLYQAKESGRNRVVIAK